MDLYIEETKSKGGKVIRIHTDDTFDKVLCDLVHDTDKITNLLKTIIDA